MIPPELKAELNGLKPWRRGGFRCFWEAGKLLAAVRGSFLGGWLVVENARKVFFFLGIQSVRFWEAG